MIVKQHSTLLRARSGPTLGHTLCLWLNTALKIRPNLLGIGRRAAYPMTRVDEQAHIECGHDATLLHPYSIYSEAEF